MELNPIRLVARTWRAFRLWQVIEDLQEWERQGRDLIAQAVELTDPDDDQHLELLRLLEALDGQ